MAPDDLPPDPLDDPFFSEGGADAKTRTGAAASFVPEFVRKMAVAGLGALFMTEEGLRSLAGQLKLPKEALGFILSQAEKTKDDIGRVVSEEIRRFLQSEKLREEFLKLLAGMTVEVKAEIRLVPPSDAKREAAAKTPSVVVSEIKAGRGRRAKKDE